MTGKIKLVHSGGNAVSIAVPTSNPSASEVEFKLPQSDGSSGQAMVTDASGNLSFANKGKFASYALLADEKSNGTNGGTFTAGLQIRDINTKISDADNIVTLSNNIMTLGAGTYVVQASAPAFKVNEHQLVLYRESGTQTTLAKGTNELASQTYAGAVRSFVRHRFTTSGSINLQIRHHGTTTKATNGFGLVCNFTTEVYTIVEIFKEA